MKKAKTGKTNTAKNNKKKKNDDDDSFISDDAPVVRKPKGKAIKSDKSDHPEKAKNIHTKQVEKDTSRLSLIERLALKSII